VVSGCLGFPEQRSYRHDHLSHPSRAPMNAEGPAPFLRPPRLRTVESEHRHASWLELFFDLVFVVAVAQVANGLADDQSALGFARFGATFLPVAWAWMGFTFYANRFDTDDLLFRAMMVAGMLAVAAMAVNAAKATTSTSAGFALSYVAVRAVLILLYVRAYLSVEEAGRQAAARFVIGFTVGALIWAASALVPEPARFWLWGAGLAVELATPPGIWRLLGPSPIHAEHIEERFGLFTIIVLGESVLAVVVGTDIAGLDAAASLLAALTFVVAVCVWWIYFDFADTSVIRQGLRGLIYVYGHLPLFAGVAMLGVGAKLAIEHAGDAALDAEIRWALCAGLALYLLSLSFFHVAAVRTTLRERALISRLSVAATLLALAAVSSAVDPLLLVTLVAAVALAQLVIEATGCRQPVEAQARSDPPPAPDP
jgi:low temperature requirement protein LtrA